MRTGNGDPQARKISFGDHVMDPQNFTVTPCLRVEEQYTTNRDTYVKTWRARLQHRRWGITSQKIMQAYMTGARKI
jgi:hypothetical protein